MTIEQLESEVLMSGLFCSFVTVKMSPVERQGVRGGMLVCFCGKNCSVKYVVGQKKTSEPISGEGYHFEFQDKDGNVNLPQTTFTSGISLAPGEWTWFGAGFEVKYPCNCNFLLLALDSLAPGPNCPSPRPNCPGTNCTEKWTVSP